MAEAQRQLQTVGAGAGEGGAAAGGADTGFFNRLEAFSRSQAFRQLSALVGLAAVAAVIGAMILWSQKPSMAPLYADLADQEAAEVTKALRQTGIPFEIDSATGQVMVPRDRVHEARMQLAGQGLPNSSGGPLGLEFLQQEQALGTSQFMETKRYQHALEVELARSVTKLSPVEKSRVHLALPEESVFVRDRTPPSASVLVHLFPGRTLSDGQVAAIVHLVSSSIPHMTAEGVTVVDQQGRMLSNTGADGLGLSDRQYDYQRKVEDDYASRIERLLTPVVGQGRVQASVSAKLDFSRREQTRESYGPEEGVVRSEQVSERQRRFTDVAGGVPGALSNQPPGAGTTQPQDGEGLSVEDMEKLAELPPANSQTDTTRNYEVDRTLSHVQSARGEVEKLTVAVVVDNKMVPNDEGVLEPQPLTETEIEELRQLVREAVGFDAERGDRITITNTPFVREEIEAPPAEPIWKQDWIWNVAKQVLVGLVVIYLFFAYVRPLLKRAGGAGGGGRAEEQPALEGAGGAGPGGEGLAEDRLSLGGQTQQPPSEDEQILRLSEQPNYERKLTELRKMVDQDPKRLTSVIKKWAEE